MTRVSAIFLLYELLSCVPVVWLAIKEPPRGLKDDKGYWVVIIGFAWFLWPLAAWRLLKPKRRRVSDRRH